MRESITPGEMSVTDTKKFRMVLGALAATILIISCTAFAYSLIPKGDTSKVIVNDVEYTWAELFDDFESESFEANGDDYLGIPIGRIINDTGLENPTSHQYRITGSDDYQKDVSWTDVENGYLVKDENKVVFPEKTRSFWVKNLVTIEVI